MGLAYGFQKTATQPHSASIQGHCRVVNTRDGNSFVDIVSPGLFILFIRFICRPPFEFAYTVYGNRFSFLYLEAFVFLFSTLVDSVMYVFFLI